VSGSPASPPSRLVLLARPGAGKSTQARRIAEILGVAHVSAGSLLRHEVTSATPLGQAVASTLEHGKLVADDVVLAAVEPHLARAVAAGGYVLDDVPRTLAHAQGLAALAGRGLAPQMALSLEVDAEECRRRLLARSAMQRRGDDDPETIDRRLAEYDLAAAPVRAFYADAGILTTVDGTGSADEVTERVRALFARE